MGCIWSWKVNLPSINFMKHSNFYKFSTALEQTINSMVAMKQKQQQQDNTVANSSSTKADTYAQESIPTSSSANISVPNTVVSSSTNDDTNPKSTASTGNLQSGGSSSTINQPPTYSTSTVSSKNEQKNICTVS